MLNIGQVVYDYTNERVIIFAGFEMLQNQKTGKCHSESAFILKDGTFLGFKDGDGKKRFEYTNLTKNGKPYPGSFIGKCGFGGHFFGVINEEMVIKEILQWAKEAIEEAEALIAEHGLNLTEHESHNGKYHRYHIGQPVEYEPKMTISAPSQGG